MYIERMLDVSTSPWESRDDLMRLQPGVLTEESAKGSLGARRFLQHYLLPNTNTQGANSSLKRA